MDCYYSYLKGETIFVRDSFANNLHWYRLIQAIRVSECACVIGLACVFVQGLVKHAGTSGLTSEVKHVTAVYRLISAASTIPR